MTFVANSPIASSTEPVAVPMSRSHGARRAYAAPHRLHRLFEEQAAREPQAIAVIEDSRHVSYAELDAAADRLARRLVDLSVGPDVVVAVTLRPGVELLVALLGTLKAGGAYLPIDPATPRERIRLLCEDARVGAVVTSPEFTESFAGLAAPVATLDESSFDGSPLPDARPADRGSPEDLAYVIYTSGSTGRPKGVEVPHRGVCNTIHWRRETFGFTSRDRVLLTLSYAFDASIWQIFGALTTGAAIVTMPAERRGDPAAIADAVRRHGVTILGVPPVVWGLLLSDPNLPTERLRMAFCGGESLSEEIRRRFCDRLSIPLHNMYGPTEASVEATWWTATPRNLDEPIGIGGPIANMYAYLLDEDLRPVPAGSAGELCLGGVGLARGYRDDEALTAKRFVPDPYAPQPDARLYRTGDRCRRLPNGNLEFLGRADGQIKLHGHRIELGEIEATIAALPDVRAAAVLLREDRPGDKRLVAYVTAGELDIDPFENRDDLWRGRFGESVLGRLRERLPSQMTPSAIVVLDSFPLTDRGKIDRAKLPAPTYKSSGHADSAQSESRGPIEVFVRRIWEETLGIADFGDEVRFFDLGGTSIHVAIVTQKLQDRLGEFVYTVALYDAPTVAQLAEYLRENYPASMTRLFGAEAARPRRLRSSRQLDASHVEDLARLVRSLPARTPEAARAAGARNPTAAFVLSPPRSGSTLFRIMLGGHPSLFAPPEMQLLNYETLAERRDALSSERDSFWLEGTVRSLMELLPCDANEAVAAMADYERRGLTTKQFYREMQRLLGERLLIEKTPHYSLDPASLRRAEEDFESPKYLHLIRHPSPMISSFEEAKLHVFFPPFLTGSHDYSTFELAELVWNVCHRNIRAFLADIPAERKMEVRFEHLVRDPETTMRGVAEFLDVPFHENMADPYRDAGRSRMTDATHPMARMLGDVKFIGHGRIDSGAADRKKGRFPEEALGEMSVELARDLGYWIGGEETARRAPSGPRALTTLRETGSGTPLFLAPPAGGSTACYLDFAEALGDDRPILAFRGAALEEAGPPRTIEETAAAYVRELRERQPEGPYSLAGWSFGGVIALEMALQLARAGQRIGWFAAIDSDVLDLSVARPPQRMRDFAAEFVRQNGVDLSIQELRSLPPRLRMRTILDALQRRGAVSADVDLREFRAIYLRYARAFRRDVAAARRYVPSGRLERALSIRPADRSLVSPGPTIPWSSLADACEERTVAGDHFSMLHGVAGQSLAETLRREIAAADL